MFSLFCDYQKGEVPLTGVAGEGCAWSWSGVGQGMSSQASPEPWGALGWACSGPPGRDGWRDPDPGIAQKMALAAHRLSLWSGVVCWDPISELRGVPPSHLTAPLCKSL